MKLPFVSRKTYEIAIQNYKVESECRQKLRKEYIDYQRDRMEKEGKMKTAYSQMEDSNKMLLNRLEFMELKQLDMTKEIRYLKRLLTISGIPYKSKDERGRRKKSER